jgi:hypothetical protein
MPSTHSHSQPNHYEDGSEIMKNYFLIRLFSLSRSCATTDQKVDESEVRREERLAVKEQRRALSEKITYK